MEQNVFIIDQIIRGEMHVTYVWCAVYAIAMLAVTVASFIDLYYGTEAAKAKGEEILSNGLRRTIRKDLAYFSFVLMALFSDVMISMFPFYSYPFLTMLFSVACVFIEGKSVREKLRIINNPAASVPSAAKEIADRLNSETVTKIIELLSKSK